ncbi:MAG: GatB/YqeY domain-containing protein [Coprobacillus sp.]|nr:GatB/YqeY domain-containing protein [Coprobacillus sp.]
MLLQDLQKANIQAMKDHDTDARSILSIVLSRANDIRRELDMKGEDIKDSDILSLIQKALKELSDEKEGYATQGNLERVEGISHQEEVISAYLPKQLSEEEIRMIIDSLTDKSIPSIMKHFKSEYAGSVDMSLVSSIAKSYQ